MLGIGQGFGRIVQVAYLVEDMDAAMHHWLAQAGLGPWTCFRNIELEARFDERDLTLRIHEGLAYMGDLQIQLVQSLNAPDEPTPYQAWIAQGRYGVHHVAFFSNDIDADVARAREQGFARTCSMQDKSGHRYYYCQSSTLPDVWIEFLESYPELTKIFEEGVAAAAAWDGSEPIRNIEYADF